jgi:hypothetical protein
MDLEEVKEEGFELFDKSKCGLEFRTNLQDMTAATLLIRGGGGRGCRGVLKLVDIFCKLVSQEFLRNVLAKEDPATWRTTRTHFYKPSMRMLYKMLAVYCRIQGQNKVPTNSKANERPLRDSIVEALGHFNKFYPNSPGPGVKVIENLFAHFLFDHEWFEALSINCQSIIRSLGSSVAGDEKLFHFTGNSAYIILLATVRSPGQWEGLYNKKTGIALVHYYSPDSRIGRKNVMSNAFQVTQKKHRKYYVPVFDEFGVLFSTCDRFNRRLYQCTWPHKRGGRSMLGDRGAQHNYAMSSVLQNVFNVWFQCSGVDSKSVDFSTNCLLLADELYAYDPH